MTLHGHKILIVENEFLLAQEISEVVGDLGGAVLGPVRDAPAALNIVAESRPHAAVVDINLGDGPAFDVADQLDQQHVPIVFVTGYDQDIAPRRYRRALWLIKPYRLFQLEEALHAAVRSRN